MNYEYEIRLDRHAYLRYCERVKPIGWQELENKLLDDLNQGKHFKDGYLFTGGVWWRATRKDNVLVLHTCYGLTHMDIPAAVRWAKLHGDRIALGDRDGV